MPHETSMSAASRKAWNLKVVQRHDPDILCIWDQVSYVMLMQYSSNGWTKTSVEGSLFLFDRRGLPRYGFFILNRSSSQNYMHLLTAEDNLEVQESYVIFRAKGSKDAPVLGLWAAEPEHRKHLGDTLLGLHAHIKSESTLPFYDPAVAFSQIPTQSSAEAPTQNIPSNHLPTPPNNLLDNSHTTSASTGTQSLNDLFARLTFSASANTSTPPAQDNPSSNVYATSAVPAIPQTNAVPGSSFSPTQTISSTGPLRGQALLDSLFAMASPAPAPAQPSVPTTSSTLARPQPIVTSNTFGTSTFSPQTAPPAPTGSDLLAQLFANLNSTQPVATTSHSRHPSTPPSTSALPPDPAIIRSSTKLTSEPPKSRRNNTRRGGGGYATDTSPRPLHRMSVFDEDASGSHSRGMGSEPIKPRVGRALVPFQSDTGPEYHPDPTRPHVSSRYPTGVNGEEAQVYTLDTTIEEEAEDEIFYDGRGGKGPSPKRSRNGRRQRNGRGGGVNGNANGRSDAVTLDRQVAAEVLMQGIEWDEGIVGKELFLQSIYALLTDQEFVDQLYNDYKVAQTRRA